MRKNRSLMLGMPWSYVCHQIPRQPFSWLYRLPWQRQMDSILARMESEYHAEWPGILDDLETLRSAAHVMRNRFFVFLPLALAGIAACCAAPLLLLTAVLSSNVGTREVAQFFALLAGGPFFIVIWADVANDQADDTNGDYYNLKYFDSWRTAKPHPNQH